MGKKESIIFFLHIKHTAIRKQSQKSQKLRIKKSLKSCLLERIGVQCSQ